MFAWAASRTSSSRSISSGTGVRCSGRQGLHEGAVAPRRRKICGEPIQKRLGVATDQKRRGIGGPAVDDALRASSASSLPQGWSWSVPDAGWMRCAGYWR
jgi:hypothetical protein